VRLARLACVFVLAAPLGCGERGDTAIERLRHGVGAYVRGESEPTEQQIDAWFAQVDADVAELRADAATETGEERAALEEEARAMQQERLSLWQTYVKARVERLRGIADSTVRDIGKQIGQGLEEAGRAIRESMEKPPPEPAR
jgi:hypothetical protein